MNSNEIMIAFEKMAIEWGNKNKITNVGDVVEVTIGYKRPQRFVISNIDVSLGRNTRTTLKTLVVRYCGRKLVGGRIVDPIGGGRFLYDFTTIDGKRYNLQNDFGVNEMMSDAGLSFDIEFDPDAKAEYPNAHGSYLEPYHKFEYPIK